MKRYLKFLSLLVIVCLFITSYFPVNVHIANATGVDVDITAPGVDSVNTGVMPTPIGGYKTTSGKNFTDDDWNPYCGYGLQIGIKSVYKEGASTISARQEDYNYELTEGKIAVTEKYLKTMPCELADYMEIGKQLFIRMSYGDFPGTKDWNVAAPFGSPPIRTMQIAKFKKYENIIGQSQTSISAGPIYNIIRNHEYYWRQFKEKKLTYNDIAVIVRDNEDDFNTAKYNFVHAWKTYESGIDAMKAYINEDSVTDIDKKKDAQLRYLDLLVTLNYCIDDTGATYKAEIEQYLKYLNDDSG